MAGPVFFIADAHLGSSPGREGDSYRLERLLPFLEYVGDQRAEHLYILGDLFDFWFEYHHVMPTRHFRILAAIRRLVDRGVPVSFLGGNHDWWAGPTFAEVAGMTTHREPLSVEHQGKRLFLAHGDGLASHTDSGYLILKRILRNAFTVRILRLVHPDLAYALGHRFSKFSRSYLTNAEFRVAEPLAKFIDDTLAAGHDAFLMGHLHARYAERRPGGGLFFVLGDWMKLFTALRLQDGEFQWEDWSSGRCLSATDPTTPQVGGHTDD